jgi:hypothetical protein
MKYLIIPSLTLLLVFFACNNNNNPTPSNNTSTSTSTSSTTGGTTTGGTTGGESWTVNGTSYSHSNANNLYFWPDYMDQYYDAGNSTPVNGGMFQLSAVDPDSIQSLPSGSSQTLQLQSSITVMPNPSYGKASIEMVQNVTQANEVVWETTGGTLTISRSGYNYTFSWTNVPVARQDDPTITSTSTGSCTFTIQ